MKCQFKNVNPAENQVKNTVKQGNVTRDVEQQQRQRRKAAPLKHLNQEEKRGKL